MDINRINSNLSPHQRDDAQQGENSPSKSTSAPMRDEQAGQSNINISNASQRLNQITDKLDNIPHIDAQKVAKIKQQIANGTYPYLDNANSQLFENLADKIIDFESDLDSI